MLDFMPSQRILEEICGEVSPKVQYTVFPADPDFPSDSSKERWEETLRHFTTGLIYQIADNFMWAVEPVKKMKTQKIGLAPEAIQNALAYSPINTEPIVYGLFMGPKGVCHGFKDGGDFFRSEAVKEMFENKVWIKEFDEAIKGVSGWRIGVNRHIYPFSDIIEVDTKEGILYCVQLKSSLQINQNS
jgi:hypothetical protein